MRFISISDPAVLAIPIRDNGEPLVRIARYPELAIAYATEKRDPGDAKTSFMLRKGVVERLLAAQRHLPAGVRLLIREGYRPLALQRKYFEKYREELKAKHPNWSEERLYNATCLYVAPPDSVPPHTTGGAVDLTLQNAAGQELDMGTRLNATPEESGNRCFTYADDIREPAKERRQILIEAMEEADFVNYSSEWWHWSYGDRYWAHHKKERYALYGSI